MIIKFKVSGQEVYCMNRRFVAAGSVDFLKAQFAFDENWAGYAVAATFTNLDTDVSIKALLGETHACNVPHEVLEGAGRMNVYVEGVRGGSVATTAVMKHPLPIRESGRKEAGESVPPTPDIYQQLLAQFNAFRDGEALKGKIESAVAAWLEGHPDFSGGADGTPVGTIIPYMGTKAPDGYLACDGAQYQAEDYPLLAAHFREQFSAANYFGGDGAATFAVPDLRGEFLRGTGTATRNTGAGSAVGQHQHPTELPYMAVRKSTDCMYAFYDENPAVADDYNWIWYADKTVNATKLAGITINKDTTFTPTHTLLRHTARPTNTSVLYCIKY